MRRRKLGRTGLEVSEVSLGTVEIGIDYGLDSRGTASRPPESEAALLLHRALDLGINLIDTARAYGESEAIIGRTLNGRRREFVLCTKVASFHGQNLQPKALREKVTASIQESLRLLQTDAIDVLMIHSAPVEAVLSGELIDILEDVRRQGDIRWIGASVYGEDAALAAVASGRYDCLQVAYSMLDRRMEARAIPDAAGRNVGLVARSVLLKGSLTERYRYLPESLAPLRESVCRLETLAAGHGMALPEMAYRYVLTHDIPETALVGASSVREVEAAVQFAERGPLPPEVLNAIHAISIGDERLLNPANWHVG